MRPLRGRGTKKIKNPLISVLLYTCIPFFCLLFYYSISTVSASELNLEELLNEALENNPEILAFKSKEAASKFKIPQAKSLPDPMLMLGYMNEGTRDLYTFGEDMSADSQWMFSVSQMFPFPGKLSLKEEMASRDARGIKALSELVRLKTILRVKEFYYDLFYTYKNIELVRDKSTLFSKIEEAALARYSSGLASQQEVIMAQIEKYMLLEKEEMLKQKIQSIEAMLNSVTGKDINYPVGKPSEVFSPAYSLDMNELLKRAFENSPDIKAKEEMIAAAEARLQMAKKEYYPDFTVNASYFAKSADFQDMWSLTTAINIPIFYESKQKQAVLEAEASLAEAKSEQNATKLMVSSAIRDNFSMLKTSERLMELYKNALIPKSYQDFEAALVGYTTGKTEAITVISVLKSFLDFELSYWQQAVEREKAIARLEAITAVNSNY